MFLLAEDALNVGGQSGAKLTKIGEKSFLIQDSDLPFMFHRFFDGHGPGMDAKRSIDGLDV